MARISAVCHNKAVTEKEAFAMKAFGRLPTKFEQIWQN